MFVSFNSFSKFRRSKITYFFTLSTRTSFHEERGVSTFFFAKDLEKGDTRNRSRENLRRRRESKRARTKVIWGLNRSVWWLMRPGTCSKSPEKGAQAAEKGETRAVKEGISRRYTWRKRRRRTKRGAVTRVRRIYLEKGGLKNTPRISSRWKSTLVWFHLTRLANMSPFSRIIGGSAVAWLRSVEFLQFRENPISTRISGARQARRGKFFGFTRDALPRR